MGDGAPLQGWLAKHGSMGAGSCHCTCSIRHGPHCCAGGACIDVLLTGASAAVAAAAAASFRPSL